MLTVIHLSDLHIHISKKDPDNKNAQRLVQHLINRYGSGAKGSRYVVLTGDLTDDGDLRQYRNLQAQVLTPLAKRFTLLPAPGNHDYAWKGNVFKPRTPAYFARTVVQPCQKAAGPGRFPCFTARPRQRVVFIGLDSADPKDKVHLAAGIVDAEQRATLAALLKAPAHRKRLKVVYLHHHPFDRGLGGKLKEADKLLEVLACNAQLVLFGHRHKHEAFFGWHHVPLMLASGKVTEVAGGNALTYRVLEISKGEVQRVYSEEIARAPGTA